MEPQHILVLEAQNIKNLKAVRLEPNGETVTVGGDNGAGKSALFDVIQYGFGGGHEIPDEPVRKGQDEGRILLQTEDLVVRRILRREGSDRLVVENKEGARFSSPQTMLNELQSALSFDPLRFKQASSREQVETLKGLVDFDFDGLEEKREAAYEERREVGREKKSLEGQLEGLEYHEDAPDEEKSAKQLTAELKEVREHNEWVNDREEALEDAWSVFETISDEVDEVKDEISRLKDRLDELQEQRKEAKNKAQKMSSQVEKIERKDPTPIEEQIDNIQEVNAKVRANEKYAEVSKHVDRTEGKYAELTNRIDTLDHRKQQAIQQADLPVDGLTFEDDTVLYEGVPFEQISQGEAIRVSVAMGLALNPDLRVLLVRDASLLDRDNLSTIRDMAAEHDAQVWLERVGEGSEVQVVIEDGQVRETRETPETLFG